MTAREVEKLTLFSQLTDAEYEARVAQANYLGWAGEHIPSNERLTTTVYSAGHGVRMTWPKRHAVIEPRYSEGLDLALRIPRKKPVVDQDQDRNRWWEGLE